MSTVEIETGRYVKRWAFWNPATWSIPKLYWDAWSQEQRLHAICRQLEKIIKYADYLGVNVDDIAARLKAIEDGQLDELITAKIEEWFEENEPQIIQAIETLQGDIADEVLARENADGVLDGKISDEADARALADTALENADDAILKKVFEKPDFATVKPIEIGRDFVPAINITTPPQFSAICRKDNMFYGFYPYNVTGNDTELRMYDKEQNLVIVPTVSRVQNGHANSCCYDENANKIYCAWLIDYSTGQEVNTTKVNRYNTTNFALESIMNCDEVLWGISFDHVAKKLYGMGMPENEVIPIYELDSTTLEILQTRQIEATQLNGTMLQDFAVNDSIVFICNTSGSFFTAHLNDEKFTPSFTCSNIDLLNIHYMGEGEGIEFDENGNFYQAFTYGQNGTGVIGFVCILNNTEAESGFVSPSLRSLTAGNYTTWNSPVYQIKSVFELNSIVQNSVCMVNFENNFVEPGYYGMPVFKDVGFAIKTNQNVTLIPLDLSGKCTIYTENNATLRFRHTNSTRPCIAMSTYLNSMLTINNRGSILTQDASIATVSIGYNKNPLVIGNTNTQITMDSTSNVAVANSIYLGAGNRIS